MAVVFRPCALLIFAQIFQFVISDAGPEGKFLLDLKNGSGSGKAGVEGPAEAFADARISSFACPRIDTSRTAPSPWRMPISWPWQKASWMACRPSWAAS